MAEPTRREANSAFKLALAIILTRPFGPLAVPLHAETLGPEPQPKPRHDWRRGDRK